MVSAGLQSKEILGDGAKNFNTTSYLLGLSIKQPVMSWFRVSSLFGWFSASDSRTKIGALR